MGTNYYWHHEPCEACGRVDVIHVGKASGGWSFGFRGYRHNPSDGGPYSPFGAPVVSRADWGAVFAGRGTLWNEYGVQIAQPVAWLDALVPPDPSQRRWEDSRQARGPWWNEHDEREWRDTEGFRFYDGEFS